MSETKLTSRGIRSEITSRRELRLTIVEADLTEPAPDEVVVRVEASPINPSDLWVLLGPADLASLRADGPPERRELAATVPATRMDVVAGRLDSPLAVGNEGAGTVVRAGVDAQEWLGRRVAMTGGGMWATLRKLPARACVALPDGVSAKQGAAIYVNPMTALAMVETMRREGHTALVHTAAASNVGQMLLRVCLADEIELVNVVRSPDQASTLRSIGATHVVDSSTTGFEDALTDAIAATGATLAFDAVGGGELATTILGAMERALVRTASEYQPYGAPTLKQVLIYGALNRSPTIVDRSYGMAWSVGGFLLPWFLERIGPERTAELRSRVLRELETTFASRYADTISMTDALDPERVRAYARRATGHKFLIDPSRP